MRKIIRLTESDLTRIVKRVISEQNNKTPTYNNPLCNNMTGSAGTGTETKYKACVWKDQYATYIKLSDEKGSGLVQATGEDFTKAYPSFVQKIYSKLPGKSVGIDLPVPLNPDQQ
jgi:hypothetical protein